MIDTQPYLSDTDLYAAYQSVPMTGVMPTREDGLSDSFVRGMRAVANHAVTSYVAANSEGVVAAIDRLREALVGINKSDGVTSSGTTKGLPLTWRGDYPDHP